MSLLSARAGAQRFSAWLRAWWHAGWHEAHALSIALGIHSLFVGLVISLFPGLYILWFEFGTAAFYALPGIIGIAAVYLGIVLMFAPASNVRYAALIISVALWGYVLYSYITASLYPVIASAMASGNIVIAVFALVRARAWFRRQ
jgi:hypothetical protein